MEADAVARGESEAEEPDSSPGGPGLRWVAELVGPDDYWLTLTDAARVTRRQEVTIRRWVASGSLPVRNRPLGLNKRTRHVRASDLARLSPIVDASATISGAAAHIDLLSIPVQQAEILAQYHQAQQQMQALTGQVVETSTRQQQEMEQALARIQTEVAGRFQRAGRQQAAVARQISSLQQAGEHLSRETQRLQEEQQTLQVRQESDAKHIALLRQTETRHQWHLERLEERAEREREQVEKQRAEDVAEREQQQRRMDDLAEQLAVLFSTAHQLEKTLTSDSDERRQAQATSEEHMQQLHASLARLAQQTADLHQQAAISGQLVQDLESHVREAGHRSQLLSDQLAQQQRQVEQLTQQMLTLTAAIANTTAEDREQKNKLPRRSRGRRSAG